eukprot:CAMPEP_0172357482 /NCGR_PEP_ID=MMETSP1060-20121228/1855_1 /TAXON_ID=37318 /ORGANISM="Pseudo-nitzschia pungens, Strain cf. cingulata" /LENGTH=1080 /DNA_ID=CAMNT_0013078191 /DNA_START=471 /DNA_END=3713 /DNA_ORIENTATION=+
MSSAATATAAAARNKNKNRNRNRPPEDRGPQTRNNNINAIAVTPQSKRKQQPKPKPKHKAAFLRKRSTSTLRTSLDRRMSVDKEIVDELLLVCGVIGTTTSTASASASSSSTDSHDSNDQPSLIPVTDCLNWLQDLQRALRRDDDLYRPISLLLGQWKIVEQKLLPLVVSCKYDTPLVVTVLKILVILTKPLAENTQRAGQMVIDVNHKNKSNNNNNSKNDRDDKAKRAVVEQQIRLRENALAQAEQRMDYKRLVAYWSAGKSSGTRSTSSNKDKPSGSGGSSNNKNGILSVFVSLLAEPLSKSGASRTDADHLTIELVLHLIRNLLSAQPLLNTSPETSRMAARLHQDMIVLLEKELVLEILLVIGQDLELRENAQYNLLVMEILHNLTRAQDPTAVAKSLFVGNTAGGTCGGSSRSGKPPPSSSVLASMRLQEKAQRKTLRGVRHGHFSGTWVRKQADGTKRFVSAVEAVNGNNSSIGSSSSSSSSHGPSRSGSRSSGSSSHSLRSGRQSEPFIGSGRTLKVHTKNPMGAMTHSSGPSAVRAHKTLHKFCERFVADCYGPFAKSLKNEFRRDSQRLEERDKMVFFRLVWFFAQWSRARKTKKTVTDNSGIGKLIITMDVFTFHLVLNAAETYHQQKKPTKLASAVAVYSEMIHLLYRMYHNQDDPTEHDMAIGLIDRLFYHGQDALDPLPKLLARWTPGTSTREYLCDLVEIAHVSLKLLEANTKEGIEFVRSKPANGNGSAASGLVSQKIAKMKMYASTFDVQQYFAKNIVSNRLVTMYTYLMDQYKVNAAVVNHRIVTMFRRLMRFEIATPEVVDDETDDCAAANPNPLGIQRTTLEPMLYNLQVIVVMERILNDSVIRNDASYEPLVQLCTGLMHGFWCAAESNPMLYVECLFQNAGYTPHRFCEAVTNKYVTEELRMMAEREQLAEEQERLVSDETGGAATATATANRDDNDDDDDEAEHEFTGDAVVSPGETAGAETDSPVTTEQEPTSQESSGAEASSVEAETAGEDSSVVSKKQTKKRGLDDDSSDDEAIFGSTTEETQSIAKRRKHVLDDDDDDDDSDDDDKDGDGSKSS